MAKTTKKIAKAKEVKKVKGKITKEDNKAALAASPVLPKGWGKVTLNEPKKEKVKKPILKKGVKVRTFDAIQELLDINNLEKSVKECIKKKDYEGVLAMISIYSEFMAKSATVKLKPQYMTSPFMDEILQYCNANPPCQVVDSDEGWAVVCKVVNLDVRITTKGNNPFQEYSSDNNSYHKVKNMYGVMAVISWDKDNSFLRSVWDNFPDLYEVETPAQIAYYLDKLGKV